MSVPWEGRTPAQVRVQQPSSLLTGAPVSTCAALRPELGVRRCVVRPPSGVTSERSGVEPPRLYVSQLRCRFCQKWPSVMEASGPVYENISSSHVAPKNCDLV